LFGNAGNDILWGGNGVTSGEDRDTLFGGDDNDLAIGGIDNDVLNGGNGADKFGFIDSKVFVEANLGVDSIQDFGNGSDRILLDKRVFTALSGTTNTPLNSRKFAIVANDATATGKSELIIYSSSTGKIFYNENGSESGFGAGGQFASMQEQLNLVAQDFVVV
jgi:Ca2+-binding RTX toxin-like protein